MSHKQGTDTYHDLVARKLAPEAPANRFPSFWGMEITESISQTLQDKEHYHPTVVDVYKLYIRAFTILRTNKHA